ncbi:arsenic resistance protein [Shouchella sp. JSM 1781072]|uniref:arsenic resistance protein n=1 Tax=Shouchella sp. JSM 1781072 TaxID=3344581 RepID=UPI0035BF1375
MNLYDKIQPLLILIAAGIGLILGQLPPVGDYAELAIFPFLFLMLYGIFLSIPFKGLTQAYQHKTFFITSVVINFIWTPLLAWGLGALFLADHPALWLGFILLLVTPCTDWYLIFTSIAKGNISLSTSILPINLILQVCLLPVYLLIFAGSMASIQVDTLIESIVGMFILPFLFAAATRYCLKNHPQLLTQKVVPFFSSMQLVFLCFAIVSLFASQGSLLIMHLDVLWLMLIPLLLFFAINFIVGQSLSQFAQFSYETKVSLTMTIIARNSPIALAIVLTAFPEQPLIALALIIGPLIELPVLAFVSFLLLKRKPTKVGH